MSLLRGQGGRVPIEDGSGRLALRGLGAIADHRQGEAAGSRRNRPKADLDRESGSVLSRSSQPRAGKQLMAGGDEDLQRAAWQFAVLVAEHLFQAPVHQPDFTSVIGECYPV